MRCAKCTVDIPQPEQLQIGDVFVPLETAMTYEPHLLGSDYHVTRSKGMIVRWVVCDKCAGKAHDRSWLVGLLVSMGLLFIAIAGLKGYFGLSGYRYQDVVLIALCAFPFALGVTVYCAGYWLWKGPEYRSLWCRDSVLEDAMDLLLTRDDFVAKYGRVGPRVGQCLGRFSRG